ncbi:glycosyl hydrolase [Protaetiibacter intestinalis]|uniref:GH26 domain-containing protein n=1 Tax=Protaetiibacter intestinalis TaxID=2419774 RepID=A0A387B747_9MICO|nr:glycosyl hydrolase [Protaetiibacter intestinalis]AYF98177.1 hypothetical protein D7I47_07875 [Protaetiibacter intestinalis]
MSPTVIRTRILSTLAGGVAAALVLAGAVSAAAAPAPTEVAIADTGATAETRSLFAYLRDQQGQGVLFGQQHATDYKVGTGTATPSDVQDVTGDLPAVFGFDTLTIDGGERPGVSSNTPEQNADLLGAAFVAADAEGAIPTLSAHMRNFITGGNYADLTGRVVASILPGGDHNADFRAYLDLIARAANAAERGDGSLVPIIFRPFHENTGSWFWWGAANTTAGEYKEIFRYTVEYLRDVKGVHNLLYAFSPNGTFDGDAARYLETYPGDAWVDVLGYDSYENSNAPENSDTWIASAVTDLAMVTDLAAAHGKISAFTEFGRNGDRTIGPSGNKSLNYFTDLLAGLTADAKAKRVAFMLTWANFGGGQIYVPPVGHEMAQDFADYYDDPYTVFASELPGDVHTRTATAAAAELGIRIVTPASGSRVATSPATVRVKLTGADDSAVTAASFTVAGLADDTAPHTLALDGDGYWSASWAIAEDDLANASVTLTATATVGADELTATSTVTLGAAPELAPGVIDDFEGYGDDAALRTAYTAQNTSSSAFSLVDVVGGTQALKMDYSLAVGGYLGLTKSYSPTQNWSGDSELHLWLDPDASDQRLVIQITAGGLAFEGYPSLAGDAPGEVVIPFADFRTPTWQNLPDARLTPERLADVSKFGIYLNQSGATAASGSIVIDDIRTDGDGDYYDPEAPPTSSEPVVVEDFESYASTTAARAAWANRGSPALRLDLATDHVGSGEQAGAFGFDFTSDGYNQLARWTSPMNWAGRTQLSFWVDPGDAGQTLLFQFRTKAQPGQAEDTFWNLGYPLTGDGPQEVSLPFSDATIGWPSGLDPALRPTDADLADVKEFVIMATQSSGTAPATGTFWLDDIRADGGTATEPEYPAGTAFTLDDFEGYADDAALRAGWNNRGDAAQLSLETEHVGEGAKATAYSYDFSSQNYTQVARWVGGQNWVDLDGVNFWLDPAGHAQKVIVQFRTGPVAGQSDDTFWNLEYAFAGDAAPGYVHLPFTDAVAGWPAGISASERPSDALLSSVTEVVLMLAQSDTADTSGTVYLDDVSVGPAVIVIPTEPGEPTPPSAAPEAAGSDSLTPELENRIRLASTQLHPGDTVTVYLPSGYSGEYVAGVLYSTPTVLGGWQLVTTGDTISLTIPSDIAAGSHRLAVQDADGAVIGWVAVTVSALAATGAEGELLRDAAASALLALLAGGGLVAVTRRRPRGARG